MTQGDKPDEEKQDARPEYPEIIQASWSGDVERLNTLLAGGADPNNRNEWGETTFTRIVGDLSSSKNPNRYEIVRVLLQAGADPRLLDGTEGDDDRGGPLTYAMLNMDTEMMRLLLEAGADPNTESGASPGETFYDWAEFDYRYEVYDFRLPEEPAEADRADEGAWLLYLDRLAVRHGKHRPDHLFLLRGYGARSCSDGVGTGDGAVTASTDRGNA